MGYRVINGKIVPIAVDKENCKQNVFSNTHSIVIL